MLIKFESKAAAPFVMLDSDAQPLISGMGIDNKVEGAVSGDNLSDALARLESALATQEAAEPPPAVDEKDEEDSAEAVREVRINARAAPLLAMLRKALAEGESVMWKPE